MYKLNSNTSAQICQISVKFIIKAVPPVLNKDTGARHLSDTSLTYLKDVTERFFSYLQTLFTNLRQS